MAKDERLREALLELQFLRDREARTLEETRALLECLEDYSQAPNPSAALASIFASLKEKIGATISMVVDADSDDALTVSASDADALVNTELTAPVDLFGRPRNVTDLSLLGAWKGAIDFSAFGGLLVAPVQNDKALISLRRRNETFGKDSLNLLIRLAGFAAQAVQNEKIASENNLLAATIAGSSSGFSISDATDRNRPLVYVNEAFERISGYRSDEVIGKNCRFLSAEAEDSPERKRLREAVRSCSSGTFLLRNRRKSGELFWNELTLFPVRDAAGTIRNLVATQTDVTERVAASRERDRATARMERALAATEDAFLVLEADGRVAFANGAVDQLFPAPGIGWAIGSAFKANWDDYLARAEGLPGRITKLLRDADLSALSAQPGGQEIDLPDGCSVLMRAARLDDGGLVVSATDVTARKSAQQLLGQRLAAIEAATDGIAVTDKVGQLIYVNPAAGALLGFGADDDGLGKKWHLQYPGAEQTPLNESFECRLTRQGQDGQMTHEITGSPLENGGLVIVLRDITDSLATEAREEELTRDLIRLQRQQAIAQLTAGIAHDFNNLLSAINGSAALIGMSDDLPESARPHLARITSAGAQSAKLVNRLLDIGAGSEAEGIFDLSSVLADLPELVRPSLPDDISFEVFTTRIGVALRGNPGALSQVLINLCLNGRDAIGNRPGHIELRASRIRGHEVPPVAVGTIDQNGRYARLAVCDTGAGMDSETAASIFKPYFTTKGRMGTGLGLAIVAMQVQSVGGAIGVASTPGLGAMVSIYWPLAALGQRTDDPTYSADVDLAGRTVIVVDDDPDVAHVISTFLEASGAEVATCEDPRDALAAVSDDPGSWSALITDYDMPEMNGGELTARVLEIAPDLPVIVVTALARRLTDPRLVNGQAASILSKPVDLDQLCGTLARLSAPVQEEVEDATAAGR